MKCKKCAAHYKTRELKCPYCGNSNALGKVWMAERTEAELEYERARREMGRKISPFVLNRVLGRILLIGCCLFGVILFLSFVIVFINSFMETTGKTAISAEDRAIMERYYEEKEYLRLYEYMSKKDLIDSSNYTYSQAGLLANEYNRYMIHKLNFLSLSEEEKQEDDYQLESSIFYALQVYLCEQGIYEECDPKNMAQLQTYQREIESYFLATLGMTKEEVRTLTNREHNYIEEDIIESLLASIKLRRAWL